MVVPAFLLVLLEKRALVSGHDLSSFLIHSETILGFSPRLREILDFESEAEGLAWNLAAVR